MNLLHRFQAWMRRGRVGLWYHPDYAAPALRFTSRVDNIEPRRGERVLARLLQEGVLRPVDIRTPPSCSIGQLRRFHGLGYLERAGTPETLGRVFGLEPDGVDPESFLTAARRAVGGTISAMHEAAARRLDVAINLGGGFHHAEPEQGSGFCVFNDVGVAIADLRYFGWTGRVAIVDLDYHQGNGNTVAFADDPSVWLYSIHGSVWTHTEGQDGEIHLDGAVNDRRYMATLRTTLETGLRRFDPDLVVFIAGVDVLAGDQLGSFWLSLKGVFERDTHVYQVVQSLGVPLVVTLGGGYSSLAWQANFQLVRALLLDRWRFDARRPPNLRARYTRVAETLDPRELQGENFDEIVITEEDVVGALGGRLTTRRFLDYYSAHGVEVAFERYGILDKLRGQGFHDVEMTMDPSDPARQVIRVHGCKEPSSEPRLLVELVTGRRYYAPLTAGQERLEVLLIQWLLLQDPFRRFSLQRPPLPGQEYPGLGIAREIQELMVQACRRLDLAGILNRPSHYHNALACEAEWRFVEPEMEGRFRAIQAVLSDLGLYEATRAVEGGRLRLADGTPMPWVPADHMLPVAPSLRSHFESRSYKDQAFDEKVRLTAAGLHVEPLSEATSLTAGLS